VQVCKIRGKKSDYGFRRTLFKNFLFICLCLVRDFKEMLCYLGWEGFLVVKTTVIFPLYFQDAPWPEFNFAVTENCAFPNVEGPVQPVRGLPHF
jgi:hypothetical protein